MNQFHTGVAGRDVIAVAGAQGGSGPYTYSTSFAVDENPLSESGKWVRGLAEGGTWSNPKVVNGNAVGAVQVDAPEVARYADPIAHLSTSLHDFSPDQYIEGVVYRNGSYPADTSTSHEIELLLRFSISANNAHGYEVILGWAASYWYANIVKWEGPYGTYGVIRNTGQGFDGGLNDGDVFRVEIVGDKLTVRVNGSFIAGWGDVDLTMGGAATVWSDGQPGIGFWPVYPSAVLNNFGWKSVVAGDILRYASTFDTNQNPISESGAWVKNCTSRQNIEVVSGVARAAAYTESYDDAYTTATGAFGNDYQITATVYKTHDNSMANPPEYELLLRVTDDASNTTCYECLCGSTGAVQVMRWTGPVGYNNWVDITPSLDHSLGALADGDKLRAVVKGSYMELWHYRTSWTRIWHMTDTTLPTGKPGFGLYVHATGNGGADRTTVGFTDIEVISL